MSSGSDEEESLAYEWNLGFVQICRDKTALLRHNFRSKVGGRPAWLHPVNLPTPEQLTCQTSGAAVDFLLQVYAPPPDDAEAAFHRVIFVFISQKGSELGKAGAVKALRCQLPRSNPYYSPDPPAKHQKLPTPLQASDAAQMRSTDPWRVAESEAALEAGQAPAAPPSGVRLLKEMELIVEPESQGSTAGSEEQQHMQQLMQEYEQRRNAEGDLSEQDMPAEMLADVEAQHSEEDRCFAHFAAVIAADPEQCLRYCFEEGAEPVWPSTRNVPQPQDIPPCQNCGTARRFEFQILPQLLHYLDIDAEDPESPDWASMAIYSCPHSCSAPCNSESAYMEEFVWVQMH